jgi:hypothetical protein
VLLDIKFPLPTAKSRREFFVYIYLPLINMEKRYDRMPADTVTTADDQEKAMYGPELKLPTVLTDTHSEVDTLVVLDTNE